MPTTADDLLLDSYDGISVLVTGGASFIGSHLVELLVSHGAKVTVADDFSSGRAEHLAAVRDDAVVLEGDLRSETFARRCASGRELVFHLAAQHGGRGYIDSHPVECTSNMMLDHVVFAAAAAAGVRGVVHASSACVYPTDLQADDQSRRLLSEREANFDRPGGAFADGEYGWAKLMGELQLRAFHRQCGMDAVAARIFTAYGERENESHAVIALIAKAALRLDPLPVWGDGRQTRNFTYVTDTATGLALAGTLNGFEVINVGSDQHHTILALLDSIYDAMDWRPVHYDFQLDKPVGVRSRASDNTRIRELTGWAPSTPLDEGIRRTVQWYLATAAPDRLTELEQLLTQR